MEVPKYISTYNCIMFLFRIFECGVDGSCAAMQDIAEIKERLAADKTENWEWGVMAPWKVYKTKIKSNL